MLIGSHSVDPRRVLGANYQIVDKSGMHVFKIIYLVGNEALELTQFGTLTKCVKWLKEANTIIGLGPLADAISDRVLEEEEDDDDEECRIGFKEE